MCKKKTMELCKLLASRCTHTSSWLRAAAAVTLKPMYREIGPATQLRHIESTPDDLAALTLTFSFGLLPQRFIYLCIIEKH